MPKEAPPPAQVVESIEKKADLVRDAAAELSDEIQSVEAILNKLPGRVETWCFGKHPDGGELELALHFVRRGQAWMLECGTYHPLYNEDPHNPIDWNPLSEASLRVKMAAVRMFPDLLVAMDKSQDKLVEELGKATAEAAAFKASLKQRTKEGK